MSSTTLEYLQKPGFWIVLFFLIRLVGITNPPLEIGHSWRQTTGLMVARNFLEVDANPLYPRIDDNEGDSGIIGMEFPLLNYLHYLTAEIFGYTHWYGRLINLIISSIGIFFFAKIIGLHFTRRIALFATLALLASVWFSFSRKMMADTFCISLVFIAFYAANRFLDNGKRFNLLFFVMFGSLAVLSKISAGIYFSLLIPLFFVDAPNSRKISLGLSIIIPLGLTIWWYFIWNPHLSRTFGNWYNSGQLFQTGIDELSANMPAVLERFYFSAFFGFILYAIAIAGFILMILNKQKKLILVVASIGVFFMAYVVRSGFFFHHHDYYIIPFVPVLALLVGYALVQIRIQWIAYSLLGLGLLEGIANQQHDFFIKESEQYKLQLAEVAAQVSTSTDLIVINGNGNQQQLYLSHRKGWICEDSQLKNDDYLNRIALKGCRYAFVNKHTFNHQLNRPLVLDTENYYVYALY